MTHVKNGIVALYLTLKMDIQHYISNYKMFRVQKARLLFPEGGI